MTCLACSGSTEDTTLEADAANVATCDGVTTEVNQMTKVDPGDTDYINGVDYELKVNICEPGAIKYSFHFDEVSIEELTVVVSE